MTTPSVEILDKAVEDLRVLVAQINGKYDEVTKLLLDYSDKLVKTNSDKFDTLLIIETKIFIFLSIVYFIKLENLWQENY